MLLLFKTSLSVEHQVWKWTVASVLISIWPREMGPKNAHFVSGFQPWIIVRTVADSFFFLSFFLFFCNLFSGGKMERICKKSADWVLVCARMPHGHSKFIYYGSSKTEIGVEYFWISACGLPLYASPPPLSIFICLLLRTEHAWRCTSWKPWHESFPCIWQPPGPAEKKYRHLTLMEVSKLYSGSHCCQI